MSAVAPSEYVPVAVNCWVSPAAKLAGEAGSTSIADNVGADAAATIVKLTAGLITPSRTALILTVPAAMPVALPVESIIAVLTLSLAHVT
jgi:hypothetical protein